MLPLFNMSLCQANVDSGQLCRFGNVCMCRRRRCRPYAVEKLTIRVIHGDNVPLTLLCLLRARQLFETARQEEPAIRFD